ncbi:MAG: hypothetical protein ACJAVK_001857 [Akkermansiaceae bacterium]|jgi:hypothetical protein
MLRFSFRNQADISRPLSGGLLLVLTFMLAFGAAGPWHLRMGTLCLAAGLLMVVFPPVVALKKRALLLTLGFLLFGLASFLPAELMGVPQWRTDLADLGVATGESVVIQRRLALEYQASFVLITMMACWVLTQRFTLNSTRTFAFLFVFGVAAYALIAQLMEAQIPGGRGTQVFGFFPNRNHTGTLLSLGFLCGLGGIFQAVRNKDFVRILLGLILCGVILWAILSWNISRSAIVLCSLGTVLWLALLGRRYFGRQEAKVLGLITLLVFGIYALSEFQVKERIQTTVEKITADDPHDSEDSPDGDAGSEARRLDDLDFRVPIAFDTLDMISEAPLTGVGAGQFRWVFPQYRERTIAVNHAVAVHPESSWFWLATEFGLPATACVFALVAGLFWRGFKNIRRRGNRDRALRFGCLVASAMVPLHGLFDVPAHRPALMLASLFLYVLSQNHTPHEDESAKGPSRWPGMVGGLVLLAAGVFLWGSSWFGWSEPLIVRSQKERDEGALLFAKLGDLKNPLDPFTSLALRKEVMALAEKSATELPLDGRLYRLSALSSVPISFESEATAANFAIDRILSPFSVKVPMIHASVTLYYEEDQVVKGWQEALKRAKAVDLVGGSESSFEKRTLREIAMRVKRDPNLKKLADRATDFSE